MEAMTYWLVNSGTTADPYRPPFNMHIGKRFKEWEEEFGEVHMFDKRYSIEPGDTLIFRAVGSKGARLIGIAEATSEVEESDHPDWPFQVRRRIVHLAPSIYTSPKIEAIGSGNFRTVKKVSDEAGKKAEELIRAAR